MPETVLLSGGCVTGLLQSNAQPHAIVAEQIPDRPADKVPQPSITDPLNAGDYS